jgi:Mce-associated membrane protein
VEDQPADSGDLTAAAPVPQGKAGRTRHRLPRAKARQEGEEAAAATETEVEAPAESEPETDAAPEPEAVAAPEPAPRRRRFPWRRSAPPAAPAEVSVVDAPAEVAEPDESDEVEKPADDEVDAADETTTDETTSAATESELQDSGEGTDDEPEPVLVPHRTAGRTLKVAAIVAGVLFVGAAAFAGATLQPYLADRAAVHTKFEVAETAATAITTLWTYTPEDMDSLPDRAGKFLTGDFAVEYRRFIDAIIETNKQAKVTNNTQVLGAAVESLTPTEASAIVYTNSVATSPVTKGIPSMRYLSYRLTMELRNRQWLITKMTAVTSLDLTPKL